ncbi:MAG: hypothetical protein AMXMBFR53_43420 [Gemmatimonadota bacterium]
MAWRWGLLRTRVARRVLVLFIAGALVPVLFMAGAAYRSMSHQLRQQSEERLRQVSRNARQAMMQQLVLTEAGVRLAAEALRRGGSPGDAPIPASISALVGSRDGAPPEPIMGTPFPVPTVSESDREHLARGNMVIKVNPALSTPMIAAVVLPDVEQKGRLLWAALEGDSIWGAAERFASGGATADFCVISGSEPLYCQSGLSFAADAFLAAGEYPVSGTLFVNSTEGALVIGFAELFLEAAFRSPSVWVLVAESTADLYSADLALFNYSFGVALLLGLLVVLLLASVQVRRTMTPLDALTEGTLRLAEGDMAARVQVTSPDEFGFLAASFNGMAARLEAQFQTLEAGRAVDRAVLSAMDVDGVVEALLERFHVLVSCRSMAVLVVKPQSLYRGRLFWRPGGHGARAEADVGLLPLDVDWLEGGASHAVAGRLEDRPPFLVQAIEALGPNPLVALPLVSQGRLLGAVVFESRGDEAPADEVIARARQVADQAAVGLDAVRLVGELEEMGWEALRALARAIDAKSRWTSGHSERVTALALDLARTLGLPDQDLEILHRGGLLHDIGKIGVAVDVLDAPGPLSPEEWVQVKEHPVIGGRILEPIRAFAPALPIVLQHHERWDGKGYPFGLAGEEIHPLARVLAVADTYDAMASARPYREPLDGGTVLAEIRDGAGTQFEPALVRTFLEMMAERGFTPTKAPSRRHHG